MATKTEGKGPHYAVGRGKPPRHTQFKPGQSGNAKGRKKGSENYANVMRRVLCSEIVISEGGRNRKITIAEALILRSAKLGLDGNQRSIEFCVDRFEKLDPPGEIQGEDLTQDDQEILEAGLLSHRCASLDVEDGRHASAVDPDEDVDPDDDPDPDDDGSDGSGGPQSPLARGAGWEGRS